MTTHPMRSLALAKGCLATTLLLGSAGSTLAQEPVRPVAEDLLTMAEAVRSALAHSAAIRQAEAEAMATGAERWTNWGHLAPSVRLSTGLNEAEVLQRTATDPITGGIVQLPDSLIHSRQTYGTYAALSLDWTIFDGGRGLARVREARAEGRAADHALEAARARVAASTILAYLDVLEAEALLKVRVAGLERASELLRVAEGRFATGQVAELDVLQARLAEGDAEIELMEAESGAGAAHLVLLEHLNLPSSEDSRVTLAEPVVPELTSLPPDDELQRCALEGSAELAALEMKVVAAERERGAQRFWFLPRITVGATWARSEYGQTREALTADPRNEQAYYRVGLSWTPLEQPGLRLAEHRRAQAALQAANARLDERRGAMAREVKLALDRLRRARLFRERYRENLRLAEMQREHAAERYRVGVAAMGERFQAEALSREAERQAVVARYAALRALAELQRAAGVHLWPGFIPPSCGQPTLPPKP